MSRRALLATAVILVWPLAAEAQVERGRIESCDILLDGIAFGTFSGSRIDATGGVRLTCNGSGNNNLLTVALSEGRSNSYIARFVTNFVGEGVGSTLRYNLYTDAARTTIWGNGQGETRLQFAELAFHGGRPQQAEFDIFARLERDDTPVPGVYVDQITVTVTF